MAFAVAQHTSGNGTGTGLTTGKTLPGTPTAGNLLIAFIFTGNGVNQTTLTINDPSWKQFDRAVGPGTANTDVAVTALYRYVQMGDTSTMPAFCSAGSAFFAYSVQEVSGVSGSWATDYLSSSNAQKRVSSNAVTSYQQNTVAANSFALAGYSKYNESSVGSISAGWTSDENAANSSNFGSYGCAHQAFVSSGSAVQGTFTSAGTNSNTMGIITVILTPSQPTAPNVVRVRYQESTASTPGSIQMGGTPAVGNLLVAFLSWSDGSSAGPTVNASSWNNYVSALNGSNPIMLGLYRYVQGGDTAALAALCTSGSQKWSITIFEITGVSGTFSADHISDKEAYQGSGATLVTTPDTTTANNQLCLTGFMEFGPSTPPSVSGALPAALAADTSVLIGFGATQQFDASSGTTVQTVWTLVSNTDKCGYVQSIFGPGAISASVNAVGVQATAIARACAPNPSVTAVHVAATGVARACTPSVAVAAGHVAATGVRGNMILGTTASLTGVHATGVARAVLPNPSVTAPHIAATGVPHAVSTHSNTNASLTGVQAVAVARGLVPMVNPTVRGVIAIGVANQVGIYATPISYLPRARLMRNTAVPAVGAMSNEAVAVVAKMKPTGPQPRSVEVFLVGVQAQAVAHPLQTSLIVHAYLTGVQATGEVRPVIGVGNVV